MNIRNLIPIWASLLALTLLAASGLVQPAGANVPEPSKEFCKAACTQSVGGEKCKGVCQLSKGHAGKHRCIKLHEF